MSNANEHEEDQTPGWLQHVLLFIATYIRQLFADKAERTKAQRRTGIRSDWQDFIQDLYNAEWPIIAMKAEGARRILVGEELSLDTLAIWTPGPDDVWQPPTSAQQMHLRMLGLSRFHADPEYFIRRHAQRILREAKRATTIVQQQSNPDCPVISAPARVIALAALPARARSPPGQRVRAPPWRARLPVAHCPQPRKRSFRGRCRMRLRPPCHLRPIGASIRPQIWPPER